MSTEARNDTKNFQVHGSLALKPDMGSPLDEKKTYLLARLSQRKNPK